MTAQVVRCFTDIELRLLIYVALACGVVIGLLGGHILGRFK